MFVSPSLSASSLSSSLSFFPPTDLEGRDGTNERNEENMEGRNHYRFYTEAKLIGRNKREKKTWGNLRKNTLKNHEKKKNSEIEEKGKSDQGKKAMKGKENKS